MDVDLDPLSPEKKQPSDFLSRFDEKLGGIESELIGITKTSHSVYERTTLIIRVVFSIIGLVIVGNMYLIYDFSSGLVDMNENAVQMYTHFGQITRDVHGMRGSIEGMNENMTLLPSIASEVNEMSGQIRITYQSMQELNQSMSGLNQHMNGLNHSMSGLGQSVSNMDGSVQRMDHGFNSINQNMQGIGSQINGMTRLVP